MLLETYSATDIGRKRQLNQDYVFSSAKPLGNMPNLFIVADGMGGHNAGDYASKCTTETVVNEIQNSFEKNPTIIIKKAIKTANAKIRKEASENENLFGMGTTLVIATIIGKYLQVSNIGDSRLYLLNKDGLRQVTEDHSLVEEMIRLGGLSREDARLHPDKNIITRAIEADFFTEELEAGNIVLMCSDGLTNMLEDKEIEAILLNPEKEELIQKGDALIKAANENGGKDNIAVVLVRLVEDDEVKE